MSYRSKRCIKKIKKKRENKIHQIMGGQTKSIGRSRLIKQIYIPAAQTDF